MKIPIESILESFQRTGNRILRLSKEGTNNILRGIEDGTDDNDAVNKSQFDGLQSQVTSNDNDISIIDSDISTLDGEVVKLEGNQTIDDVKTFAEAIRSSYERGTAGTGVTADEVGDGASGTTHLTLNNINLGTIAGAANEAIGALIYTLPNGPIVIEAAYINIDLTNTDGNIDADTPDLGIGTAQASGENALLSDVGATSENIMTGQTMDDVTGTNEKKTVSNFLVVEESDDHTIYLNAADGWSGAESVGVVANGSIVFKWTRLTL